MSPTTKKPTTPAGKPVAEMPTTARTRRPATTAQPSVPVAAAAPPAPSHVKASNPAKAPTGKKTTTARSAPSTTQTKPATASKKTPAPGTRTSPSPAPAASAPALATVPDRSEEAPPTLENVKPISRGPRGPYNIVRVNKKAATFRLPQDVLDLIRHAQEEAALLGRKLTNDDAVAEAVRGHYGGRRRRRA